MKKFLLLSILTFAMVAALLPTGLFAQDVDTLYEHPDTTIAIIPDANGIIYVTETGAGLKNGSSWGNATPWLNRALETADTMATKPMLWVAKGIYYGNPQLYDNGTYAFVGRAGINVYGGFAGNEPVDYNLSLRDFDQNETVLDGLQEHTVVYLNGCEWNGFHIQRGTTGAFLKADAVMRKCFVSNCLSNGISSQNYAVYGPYNIVDSCLISNNEGRGIDAQYLKITNTSVCWNGSDGICANGIIDQCIMNNNMGGGFRQSRTGISSFYIGNSIIANNNGTGIYTSSPVINSTVVNNGGNGIDFRLSGEMVKNCIVWGNAGSSIGNTDNIINCAVEGNYPHSSYMNIPLSTRNDTIGIQPNFVNPTAGSGVGFSGGDWHLLPTSACINRGCTALGYLSERDYDGNERVRQGIPDIGAYESDYTLLEENYFIHPDSNGIIYVTEEGAGNGSSWQNATSNLTQAIEMVWLYGPETRIWVAQGNYSTQNYPFYLKENLKLFGGFEGNEPAGYTIDLRNTVERSSVLDGQNHNRVLHQTIDFENGAMIDGFILTNGFANEGAGAFLMASTTLSKCRIVNNTAGENGAALYAVHDTLLQLIVENNEALGITASETPIIHCNLVRNSRGGVHLTAESMQNCLTNTIIWGNDLYNIAFRDALSKRNTAIEHCAIENYVSEDSGNISLPSNNNVGVHFVAPTEIAGIATIEGNWELDSTSVCVNLGADISADYPIVTDLAGRLRNQNGSADIGALESLHKGAVACRTMEVSIYEGETYLFYDTTLTTSGWYEHRWQEGETDSIVTLRLTVRHIMYVSVDGAGSKDGTSWANALDGGTATADGSTKLADALADASIGTDFWIQSGTYYACSDSDANKSLTLNEGIGIYGGFTGTESALNQRDTNNAPTIFSGNLQNDSIMANYSRNIFKTNELNTLNTPIILNQISIKEGYNNLHTGSALHIGGTSEIRAERCRFYHNFGSAVSNEGLFIGVYCQMDSNISFSIYGISYSFSTAEHHSYHEGAGAFTNKSSAVANLKCCEILNNSAPHDGAIFNMGVMSIDSTDISYNNASSNHTGAIFNKCFLTIANSILSYNWAYYGVSTIFSDGVLRMYNCSVDSNQCAVILPDYYLPQGQFPSIGAVACHILTQGEAEIEDCVFSRNDQNGISGGGCIHVKGHAKVKNCGFLNNYGGMDFKPGGQGGMLQIVYAHIGLDGCVFVKSGTVDVEGCVFDRDYGGGGTAAAVESGELSINRCVFTRNNQYRPGAHQEGILAIKSGELHVQNSLFANNQNTIFNTAAGATITSTSFTNCTFVNNGNELCIFNYPAIAYREEDIDFSQVAFYNSVIVGSWETKDYSIGSGGTTYYPNWNLQFTNTLFDTLRVGEDALLPTANISPDSAGNIYYCNPMFVNPTVMLGIDTLSDWSQVDFRLREGSPCINSGVLEGTDFTEESTDLAGERRIKQCAIDRGCYEYGTIVRDTLYETCCLEADSLEGFVYTGHGFTFLQPHLGLQYQTRYQCSSAAPDTILTLGLNIYTISYAVDTLVGCDTVEWHNYLFSESGEYVRTIPGSTGCDSIVTLHITVHHSVIEPVEVTICENELPYHYVNGQIDTTFDVGTPSLLTIPYTLTTIYGCDSTVTLTLTVNPMPDVTITGENEFCEGDYTILAVSGTDNYLWSTGSIHNDIRVEEGGTYSLTATTLQGCSATASVEVTEHPTVTETVEVTICENELPYHYVNGAIDTTFDFGTPNLLTIPYTLSTIYGCDSTIMLTLIVEPCDTVGIAEANTADLTLYPNPTTGIVNVQFTMNNGQLADGEIMVFDVYGRRLQVVGISDARTSDARSASLQTAEIDLSQYATGIYLVKLVNDGRVVATGKVVKQ